MQLLKERHYLTERMRAVFADRGFLEVSTPVLQEAPTPEPYLQNLETLFLGPLGEAAQKLWLHTSPELDMKRLLAAGAERIFQFAPVFRQGDRSPLHTPEFTMLEWYEVDANLSDAIGATVDLLAAAGGISQRGDLSCDLSKPPEHVSLSEIFQTHFGFDLLDTVEANSELDPAAEKIAHALSSHGITLGPDAAWQDYVHAALLSGPEAQLGLGQPTIVTGYPRCMGALAATNDNDPRCAERFEVYVCGVELANGYRELTDSHELAARMQAWGGEAKSQPEKFLDAMANGLPPSAGVALGLDRLLMLMRGAASVTEVQAIPGPLS